MEGPVKSELSSEFAKHEKSFSVWVFLWLGTTCIMSNALSTESNFDENCGKGTSANVDRDIVLASFVGDSFSLGSHWIYDREKIAELFPNGLSGLEAPRSGYHGNKGAGDLTHHGDQGLVLLESLASRRSWSQETWVDDWRAFWATGPDSYRDGATSATLENYENGVARPSGSDDFSAVSRLGPLLAFLSDGALDEQIACARSYVGATHGDPVVSDSAEWVVRVIFLLRKGVGLADAFEAAMEQGEFASDLSVAYRKGVRALKLSEDESVSSLGQSCGTGSAIPLTVWMALRFAKDPVKMLELNALAGGDTSARGMVLGMFIAASGDYAKLPTNWTDDLNALPRITKALECLGK